MERACLVRACVGLNLFPVTRLVQIEFSYRFLPMPALGHKCVQPSRSGMKLAVYHSFSSLNSRFHMKLIIQIPCYNEEQTLKATLDELPRRVAGFDEVEWLVINDGSTDQTANIARQYGVDRIVSHAVNRGLSRAFLTGLEACLARGADVIVNTDADNQYCAADISELVKPILSGQADMVIGARPIGAIQEFSLVKKWLQRLGSRVVRRVSRTTVEDATSGFRAFSRAAAQQLHVFNSYTYTLETIIQAGLSGLEIKSIPVRVNPPVRQSRLVQSVPSYIRRSVMTIFRILVTYRPFAFFTVCGMGFFGPGFALGMRFTVAYLEGAGQGKVQSLILASLLMSIGVLMFAIAIMAELIAVNRRLLERTRWQLHQLSDRIIGSQTRILPPPAPWAMLHRLEDHIAAQQLGPNVE